LHVAAGAAGVHTTIRTAPKAALNEHRVGRETVTAWSRSG
jgi:hypothetical protein